MSTNTDEPILRTHAAQAADMARERNVLHSILTGNAASDYPLSIPEDTWEMWDENLISVQHMKLPLFSDLAASCSISQPLHKTDYVWFTAEGGYHAEHTMDFDPMVKIDSSEMERHSVVVPIIRERFGWGYREAMNVTDAMSGQLGEESRREAMYAVMHAMEDMCLYGPKIGNTRVGQGLLNFTDRNTASVNGAPAKVAANNSAGDPGTLVGASGDYWRQIVYKAKDLLREDRMNTMPCTMYVNDGDWLYANSKPYDTSGGMGATSIASFIQGMQSDIVEIPMLPAGQLLFVCKDTKTVALPYSIAPAVRPETRIDMRDPYRFLIETVVSIAPKSTAEGQCGIAHLTAVV